MSIVTVGIDLAKNIFAFHGVDQNGKAVLVKPKVRREQVLDIVASLPPCLIGMEAESRKSRGQALRLTPLPRPSARLAVA
jgi:transposase